MRATGLLVTLVCLLFAACRHGEGGSDVREAAEPASGILKLVDDQTVKAIGEADCAADPRLPYFSGIQGYDPEDTAALLADDEGTSDLYVYYAAAGHEAGAAGPWHLLHYYNRPEVNRDATDVELTIEGAQQPVTVRSTTRGNRSPRRYAQRDGDGKVTAWGDQLEVRMLGHWASSRGAAFVDATPSFSGQLADRDARDFKQYQEELVASEPWRAFMREGIARVVTALRCNRPVYAHSGGGAVIAFILRFVSEDARLRALLGGNGALNVYGLEAVISKEVADELLSVAPFKSRLTLENYYATSYGPKGSATFVDPIEAEIKSLGQRVLRTRPAKPDAGLLGKPKKIVKYTTVASPPLALAANYFLRSSVAKDHAGVGFYTLRYGKLPDEIIDQAAQVYAIQRGVAFNGTRLFNNGKRKGCTCVVNKWQTARADLAECRTCCDTADAPTLYNEKNKTARWIEACKLICGVAYEPGTVWDGTNINVCNEFLADVKDDPSRIVYRDMELNMPYELGSSPAQKREKIAAMRGRIVQSLALLDERFDEVDGCKSPRDGAILQADFDCCYDKSKNGKDYEPELAAACYLFSKSFAGEDAQPTDLFALLDDAAMGKDPDGSVARGDIRAFKEEIAKYVDEVETQ